MDNQYLLLELSTTIFSLSGCTELALLYSSFQWAGIWSETSSQRYILNFFTKDSHDTFHRNIKSDTENELIL